MSYSVVDPDDCGYADTRPCDLRRLSDAAGMDAVAINRFDATPGERLPLASHSHETRAEAVVVLSGTLYVETPEGEVTVPEGSMFAAEPESPPGVQPSRRRRTGLGDHDRCPAGRRRCPVPARRGEQPLMG